MGIGNYKEDLYFGNDIKVNDYITIHQPTVKEIIYYHPQFVGMQTTHKFDDGEKGFFELVATLTATPADYDVQLNNAGVRYENLNQLDFFFMLVKMYQYIPQITKIIFGDLNLMDFERYENKENSSNICYIDSNGNRIDYPLYRYIMQILRDTYNLTENKTVWADETSRAMHMENENKRMKRRHHTESSPILLPIISMLVNDPGFKYNREQIMDLNIYFVYDCLKQLLHYQQVDHLMTGVYVGLIDTKKMNLDEALNMLRKDM